MGAYIAEVTGLLWTAIALLQMRWRRPVLIRCDNLSALHGVSGKADLKTHPVCSAARAAHLCLLCVLQLDLAYEHIRGHSGDYANELSDALAEYSLQHLPGLGGFGFDAPKWFRDGGAAFAWLPHHFWSQQFPRHGPDLHDGMLSWDPHSPDMLCSAQAVMNPFLRGTAFQEETGREEPRAHVHLRALTFNALSLNRGEQDPGGAAALHGATGRVRVLERCLAQAQVHVAGIQEARTEKDTATCGSYVRYASGHDGSHNYGVELWVNHSLPFAYASGCPVRFQSTQCTVLHAEPSILIARLTCSVIDWCVAVLHAPHRAHPVEFRRAWWSRVERVCLSCGGGAQWCLLMDGNSRVGSTTTAYVGDYEADAQDDSGECMHHMLQALDVFLPSTFTAHMWGASQTLRQKRNSEWVQSDYVGLPMSVASSQIDCWTDHGISAGHAVVGHVALLVQVAYSCRTRGWTRSRSSVRIDPAAIRNPDNADDIRQIIWNMPRHDWTMNVHQQTAEMIDHLYLHLSAAFPAEQKRMRRGYFSDKTAVLHTSLCAPRKRLRVRKWALDCTYLRCAFQAWSRLRDAISFHDLFQGSWLAGLRLNIAIDVDRIATFGGMLKYSCKDDRRLYVDQVVDAIEKSDGEDVYKHLHCLLRPRRFRKSGMDPLPQLKKLDGTMCRSSDEFMQRWREHFAALEGGQQTTIDELVHGCVAAQARNAEAISLAADDVPTLEDLVLAMRGVRARKAAGPDLIPPDICRAFSFDLALA